MFFKKNKPTPNPEPQQPSEALNQSVFAPGIPKANSVIDFGIGKPATPRSIESYSSQPFPSQAVEIPNASHQADSAYTPLPWETLQQEEQPPVAFENPAAFVNNPGNPLPIDYSGRQATPMPMVDLTANQTGNLSGEDAWRIMEPTVGQGDSASLDDLSDDSLFWSASAVDAQTDNRDYLSETFENYSPRHSGSSEALLEAAWNDNPVVGTDDIWATPTIYLPDTTDHSVPAAIQDFDTTHGLSTAFEDSLETAWEQDGLPLQNFQPTPYPAGETATPEIFPSAQPNEFNQEFRPSLANQPQSFDATIGEQPLTALAPGAFLDSVSQHIYPQDLFSSELADGERAFEEAAQYLFPSTMTAPLDWAESQRSATTPYEATLENQFYSDPETTDLGPSYQKNAWCAQEAAYAISNPSLDNQNWVEPVEPVFNVPSGSENLTPTQEQYNPSQAQALFGFESADDEGGDAKNLSFQNFSESSIQASTEQPVATTEQKISSTASDDFPSVHRESAQHANNVQQTVLQPDDEDSFYTPFFKLDEEGEVIPDYGGDAFAPPSASVVNYQPAMEVQSPVIQTTEWAQSAFEPEPSSFSSMDTMTPAETPELAAKSFFVQEESFPSMVQPQTDEHEAFEEIAYPPSEAQIPYETSLYRETVWPYKEPDEEQLINSPASLSESKFSGLNISENSLPADPLPQASGQVPFQPDNTVSVEMPKIIASTEKQLAAPLMTDCAPASQPFTGAVSSPPDLDTAWYEPAAEAKNEATSEQSEQEEQVNALRMGNLSVVGVCQMAPEKRLLIVKGAEGVFALMGQTGIEQPQIFVLKIFDHNPLAYQNTLTAVEENTPENQGMYIVQAGLWHGIISTFQDKIALHTELG